MPDNHGHVRKELVQALTQSPFLRYLGHSPEQRDRLRGMFEAAEVAHFPPGWRIIREGETSDHMYFLVKGCVRVSIDEREVCLLEEAGDVFGEMGVITGDLRSATVTALEDTTCLTVTLGFMRRLPEDQKSAFVHLLQEGLAKTLTARLRATSEELADKQQQMRQLREEADMLRGLNSELREQNLRLRARIAGREDTESRFHGPQADKNPEAQ